ncbi:immunity 8 family protein [Bradyrhizobium sp. AUGA SZCCT0431]|uniref:immunity 8 family protein n=1 Tax=Bradyrhizobium sp. AUGA SZCCT0431 TaxID=2807674 RepID=UPI001BAD9846|nr:immunity 8 family protein [Bradyrhizobium sp. AUGA SZCCT0431]MBR1148905.1 immunity 8 family protein [Bradyrhizobium sp. AUGA SZCCT0431]
MRATLKSLVPNDYPSLEQFIPDDEQHFGLWLTLDIGPADGDGAEIFQLLYCSPTWFHEHELRDGVRSGEHTIFAKVYDRRALVAFVERRVQACEGIDWHEIALKLSRLFHWEFDGYSPST